MHRYTVLSTIANALYGKVILAKENSTNELVAIKQVNLAQAMTHIPNRDSATSHQVYEDIETEKQVNRYLTTLGGHEHILRMRSDFVENGFDHLVFDYCRGGDLFSLVERGAIPVQKAKEIFQQIVYGVAYLHNKEIAHRDLSLENVLLNNIHIYICDFGLATFINEPASESVGKQYYMAPEVIRAVKYDPAKADVWSLGVMLFMMLTGLPLWHSASTKDPCYAFFKTHGLLKLLNSWKFELDSNVVDLLVQMLERRPNKRFSLSQVLNHPFIKCNQFLPPPPSSCPMTMSSSKLGQFVKDHTQPVL